MAQAQAIIADVFVGVPGEIFFIEKTKWRDQTIEKRREQTWL
jgi:hypothetical protein